MAELQQTVERAVSAVQAPQTEKPVSELGLLGSVQVDGSGNALIELKLSNPAYPHKQALGDAVEQAARGAEGVQSASVRWVLDVSSRPVGEEDPVPKTKNVILVMSGKGGVGKSTVAANMALALGRLGARVGLLDADIYGPSIPTLMGISGQPMSDGKQIQPLERFGIKLMSIGFLLEDSKTAVVWRGPMLHGALMQFLKDVNWGELDYLLLDLPPGTGDIALTLSQRVQANGAVMVTTPQEVALQDVYKAVAMNQKVGIPVLGVVENSSYFICDGCDKRHELFGKGGGEKVAEMAQAPLLGQVPLHPAVREWGDAGTPVVEAAPGSESAQSFIHIAGNLTERVEELNAEAGGLTIDRSGGVNRHLPVAR